MTSRCRVMAFVPSRKSPQPGDCNGSLLFSAMSWFVTLSQECSLATLQLALLHHGVHAIRKSPQRNWLHWRSPATMRRLLWVVSTALWLQRKSPFGAEVSMARWLHQESPVVATSCRRVTATCLLSEISTALWLQLKSPATSCRCSPEVSTTCGCHGSLL